MDDILKRLGALEGAVSDIRTRLGELAGAAPHVATKADVKASELATIKWFIATAFAVVGLVFAIAKFVH
jgi:hypothetical protein